MGKVNSTLKEEKIENEVKEGTLDSVLKELGISKVKLAKFLGVSRQMIYNYLELDDINKWPKDKKVLLLNLLGIKSSEEISSIKINTLNKKIQVLNPQYALYILNTLLSNLAIFSFCFKLSF